MNYNCIWGRKAMLSEEIDWKVRQSPPKSPTFILGTRWKSCYIWYTTSTYTHICVLAFLCVHINVFAYFSLLNDKIERDITDSTAWNRLSRQLPNIKRRSSHPSVKVGRLAVSKKYKGQDWGKQIILLLKEWFTHDNKNRMPLYHSRCAPYCPRILWEVWFQNLKTHLQTLKDQGRPRPSGKEVPPAGLPDLPCRNHRLQPLLCVPHQP